MMSREELIKRFEDYVHYFKAYCTSDAEDHKMLMAILELLKEQDDKIDRREYELTLSSEWPQEFMCNYIKYEMAYAICKRLLEEGCIQFSCDVQHNKKSKKQTYRCSCKIAVAKPEEQMTL